MQNAAAATNRDAGSTASSHSWLDYVARTGYAARGVVYLMVGFLALAAAFTGGGQVTGTRGAIANLLAEPAGQAMVLAIAVGLVAYAIWRFLQSVLDADDHGTDLKGLVIRAGLLSSCLTYLALAFYAVSIALGWSFGSGGDGGESHTVGLTSWAMSKPLGQWIVGLFGAAIVGAGFAQVHKGATAGFEKWFDIDQSTLEKVKPLCQFGLITRGITFWIIGGFVVFAAVQAQPGEARGLSGALQALRGQPYGPWLLGAAGAGLIAFSVYSFVEARYRRVRMS